MVDVTKTVSSFTFKTYRGDWKTLRAFNLTKAAVSAGRFLATTDKWKDKFTIRMICILWTANFLLNVTRQCGVAVKGADC